MYSQKDMLEFSEWSRNGLTNVEYSTLYDKNNLLSTWLQKRHAIQTQSFIWQNLVKGDHINILQLNPKYGIHNTKPTDIFRITKIIKWPDCIDVRFINVKLTTRRNITINYSIVDNKEIYDTSYIKIRLTTKV